jgi:hypothetical protein
MRHLQFLRSSLIAFAVSAAAFSASAAPQWIWISKAAKENERATVRREFDVAGDVKSASLTFT